MGGMDGVELDPQVTSIARVVAIHEVAKWKPSQPLL